MSIPTKPLAIAFVLIALYLALEHFKGFSRDVSTLTTGGVGLTKAFQGR